MPFPRGLKGKKNENKHLEVFKILKQLKVNIIILNIVKQEPLYAKFLKDLCLVKRKMMIDKKAFLIEHVSTIIECNILEEYKDHGCPIISIAIGDCFMEKVLFDLGENANLILFSLYQ